MSVSINENTSYIFNFFYNKGCTLEGVAGLLGNLYAESGCQPGNLQNPFEKSLGFSDASYTKAVNDNSYSNFVHDSAGYGLAQWTFYTRKQKLLNFARKYNASIDSLQMQCDFMYEEFTQIYKSVWKTLTTTTSVEEASNCVLTKYEQPSNLSKEKVRRLPFSVKFYELFKDYLDNLKTTDTSADNHNLDLLQLGSSGQQVLVLQTLLKTFGYVLECDGSFENVTRETVISFQTAQTITVDGICGPETWNSILNAYSKLAA